VRHRQAKSVKISVSKAVSHFEWKIVGRWGRRPQSIYGPLDRGFKKTLTNFKFRTSACMIYYPHNGVLRVT